MNQTSYGDTLTAFRAAFGNSDTPDLVLLEDKETQRMIDSQAVVPAQACVEADDYDTSDFLTRVTDYFTVEDVLWPMPFNVSNPVLYYNKALVHRGRSRPRARRRRRSTRSRRRRRRSSTPVWRRTAGR